MPDRFSLFLILALLGLSLALRSPLLFLLDVLLALVAGASGVWGRYCLAEVSYTRRFGAERLFCGEETDLWVEIVNAKPLPLAWLKAEDEFPVEFAVHKHHLSSSSKPRRRTLVNLLSLRWYERVRRHYRLTASRRGAFEFGPAVVTSGDIFGFRTRTLDVEQRHTVLVYPKMVPLEKLGLKAARPSGDFGAERRVIADPLRLAGVRAYQPGDSLRHIHWKATARRGALQTKVFDPSASRPLIVFLNSQTMPRAHEGILPERLETAVVAAASIARAGLEARHAVGLFTNGAVKDAQRRARIPVSRHPAQLTRILETLAQLTVFTLLPFESLLRAEAASLPFGATLVAVSALVSESILAALLDLRAAGHPVALVLVGAERSEAIAEPKRKSKDAPPFPPEIPVYVVEENWMEMEGLEVGEWGSER
jgi:uncharacterized protein (DUF58 family)